MGMAVLRARLQTRASARVADSQDAAKCAAGEQIARAVQAHSGHYGFLFRLMRRQFLAVVRVPRNDCPISAIGEKLAAVLAKGDGTADPSELGSRLNVSVVFAFRSARSTSICDR